MTTMIAELYDALLAAGSPEDKARKAAEAMAGYETYEGRFVRVESDIAELRRDVAELKSDVAELKSDVAELKRDMADLRQRVSKLEGDVRVMKWMLGFLLAFQVAIFIKLFLP